MQYQTEIKKITESIKKHYKPEKIILFGSYANGKPRENSDIDLVVIKKTKDRFIRRLFKVVEGINSDLGTDILVYTPEEWRERIKKKHYFFMEIAQKGKVIYEKR
jgi:predicted nucleotidyltransferase